MRVVAALTVALLLFGCGTRNAAPKLSRVEIAPTPEGPRLVASGDTTWGRRLLAAADHAAPSRFPANPSQQCHLGTTIVIVVGKSTHRYGPCSWPQSIERLRQAVIVAAERDRPSAPSKPASAADWKAVFADWYDGRMDHWHSCQAVEEALRHLPADVPTFSTIGLDLRAYARGVC